MAGAEAWGRGWQWALGLMAALCQVACGSDAPRVGPGIWAIVDIEGSLRARVERVELQTDRRSATVWLQNAPAGQALTRLPLLLDLPSDAARSHDVLRVRGYQAESQVVSRSADLSFPVDRRVVLALTLSQPCASLVSSCDEALTCVDCRGVCESAVVPTASLPVIGFTADPLADYQLAACSEGDAGPSSDAGSGDAGLDASDASDAGDASDASDAPPSDASSPPPDAASARDAAVADTGVPANALRAECALLLHMDEAQWRGAAGEVRDDSGRGNHGSAVGNARTVDGRFARAGQFDGSGWVRVPDAPSLRPERALTVAAWMFLDELPGARFPGVIAKRTGFQLDSTFAIFLSPDNKVNIDVDGEESRFSSLGTVSARRWTHVAFVYDGALDPQARVSLYLDGVLDRTAPETSSALPAFTADLLVGNLVNGGDTFVGNIDEVGLWTRALRAEEIAALARAQSGL